MECGGERSGDTVLGTGAAWGPGARAPKAAALRFDFTRAAVLISDEGVATTIRPAHRSDCTILLDL